jgi:hemoglobin/transferrin/lactoferrin receptor protein
MGLLARKSALMVGGAAIAIAAGTLPGHTQDIADTAAQPRATLLQRLVVGAGVEKVAIDTPQSVSVVEQEDIDQTQATTIGDTLRRLPGVTTTGSDRLLGQTINIRGIGSAEVAGDEGRVIVTIDGANKFYEQYRMGGVFTDPELFKRVEVLRGPASSTLYGSGALGGVINFVTKDASDFIADGESGALRLKGGWNSNRNGWLGSLVFAQRITEEFDFLLAGNYRRSDNYVTGNGTELRSTDFEGWSGLAKGTLKVGDEGTLRASYQQWDSDAADQDYVQLGGPVLGDSIFGFGTVDRHVTDRTAVLSYENPVSDNDMVNLRITGSYSNTAVTQDNSSVGCTPFGNAAILCDSEYAYQTWQLNAENTSSWYGDDWENHLTVGWQTAYQIRTASAVTATGAPLNFGFHPEGTDFKTGLYVQNEYVWDDRLTLIPGMRVDFRRLSPDASTRVTEGADDVAYSPKIAAHYKLTDALAVFGSVAHTQRFPTLDETYSTPFPSLSLDKERSNNFELGFSASAFDLVTPGDGLQLKVTGFYNDIRDLIVQQCANAAACATGGFTQQYDNIDRARIYGAEVELAYESDYVFASAAYTHLVGRNVTRDTFLATVPPHELALTLGGRVPEHGVSFGWRARFVADPQNPAWRSSEADWRVPTTRRFAESFSVHDVFVNWTPQHGQLRGWEAQFGIDNVFDTQYKEFLHNEAAKGRTFKVSLSRQFGW